MHVAVVVDPRGGHPPRPFSGGAESSRPRSQARSVSPAPVSTPRNALEDRDQRVVAGLLELADRPSGRLLVGLRDEPVEQAVRELRHVGQLRPRPLERGAELRHEVAHPRVPAGDPVGEEGAHERPPQAGAVADRVVDLVHRRDSVVHEPERLAPQRLEQAVGDEAVDLRAHVKRVHADGAIRGGRALDRVGRRRITAAHLDKRQQVDGVERVADDEALGTSEPFCSSVGRRPDVDEQTIASAGAKRSASARSVRFRSISSGADSCTSSTPATASSTDEHMTSDPSAGSGASVNRPYARRAFASTSSTGDGPGRRDGRRRRSGGTGPPSRADHAAAEQRRLRGGRVRHGRAARASPAPPPGRARARSCDSRIATARSTSSAFVARCPRER